MELGFFALSDLLFRLHEAKYILKNANTIKNNNKFD